jgi:hypothetical protein
MLNSDVAAPLAPRRRLRWMIALCLFVAASAGLGWWWLNLLNPLERQLVGTWTSFDSFIYGSTIHRTWEMRDDRTCRIHNTYHWVASPQQLARVDESDADLTWSVRNGRLMVVPERSITIKLNLLRLSAFHRMKGILNGMPSQFVDSVPANGRLSNVTPDHVTITWWEPIKRVEYATVEWVRVEPSSVVARPSAPSPGTYNVQ